MIPFPPSYYDTPGVVYPPGLKPDHRGGISAGTGMGRSFDCYFEPDSLATRRTDSHGSPEGVKRWSVFTATDLQAEVDGTLVIGNVNYSVVSRTARYSGVTWKTECEQVS